jgi:surfactin synthase thioesterase subunit
VWRPFQRKGIERLKRQMRQARVVELDGHHFLFISNQDEVVREMRKFLDEEEMRGNTSER